MNHRIALLIHYIAAQPNGNPAMISNHPMLVEAMPDALRLGLVEHPEGQRVALDHYWLLLTDRGRIAAQEGLVAMEQCV